MATPLERQFGRIAGITEMTSTSYLGSTSITIQFDLNRDIDAACRDVQAAINASRGRLPPNLPSNPTYRKVNPADAPVMILALTSGTYTKARMYDVASTILQQKLSQVRGVGQVMVGGGSPPAVRVDVNPTILNHFGIGLEDVRTTLENANANRPKGQIADDTRAWSISTTDQLLDAKEYRPLIVTFRNGAPVRVGDVSTVTDSVEDIRNAGLSDGKPSISVIIFRQPGANIIGTVDRVRALLPQLEAAIPADIDVSVVSDRTASIRASVADVQMTLAISVLLVILVVFVFLRDVRATLIPSVAVPVSLIGTGGFMYLAGYSLNNLSLMALTIATGFVVDDAIVVVENITRHLEKGDTPLQASLKGAQEIGFTVLSISISLVAVFIPILLMGGIVGRLFREFAVTLSVAIGVSLLVSLTTAPMMCATLHKHKSEGGHGRLYLATEWIFEWILGLYEVTLRWMLRHHRFTMLLTLSTIGFTVYLYIIIPKGFFPQQDTGRLIGNIQADQDTSFPAMERFLTRFCTMVGEDPAVTGVTASTGGTQGAANAARMFVMLKPVAQRKTKPPTRSSNGSSREHVQRRRSEASSCRRFKIWRRGWPCEQAQYQFTLRGDNLDDLIEWGPKVLRELRKVPSIVDVNTDQQNRGLLASLQIDRFAAARLGISTQTIDNTLYDAFGQRQVSTMYKPLNQYHVVMEVQEDFWQNPDALRYMYLSRAE